MVQKYLKHQQNTVQVPPTVEAPTLAEKSGCDLQSPGQGDRPQAVRFIAQAFILMDITSGSGARCYDQRCCAATGGGGHAPICAEPRPPGRSGRGAAVLGGPRMPGRAVPGACLTHPGPGLDPTRTGPRPYAGALGRAPRRGALACSTCLHVRAPLRGARWHAPRAGAHWHAGRCVPL